MEEWQTRDLIHLLQTAYPNWDGFDHPSFVANEVVYKRKSSAKAQELLSSEAVQELLNRQQYDELLERLEQLGKDNNLLWRQVRLQSDLNILYTPHLPKAEFCVLIRDLLHSPAPTSQRLQTFRHYTQQHNLPCKWTFPTYYLFLLHPEQEIFVKPKVAHWFLQFVGQGKAYHSQPNPQTHQILSEQWQQLKQALATYHPQDMIDIQSFIWVCWNVSQKSTYLDSKTQVELDIPPPVYAITTPENLLHDEPEPFVLEPKPVQAVYSLSQCALETGFTETELTHWVKAIQRKGQVVFYGPPGTGKTFVAQKIAQHLISGGDGLIKVIQFHPAYSYEEFVQGIRPQISAEGHLTYEWVAGVLLRFCEEARQRMGKSVLIIDEINRANLARVFGELMYLLEYREQTVQLAGGQLFSLPANVYLIGTMNTADRSIALVDYALRRRFAFIFLSPREEFLRHYHQKTGFAAEGLIRQLKRLNQEIEDSHYQIGMAFFLRPNLAQELEDIWRMEIEPYLEEYFFNQPEKVAQWRWDKVQPNLL